MCSRHIYIYDVDNLDSPLYGYQLDTNPAVLIPYYDEDSRTLFVTGRVNYIFIHFLGYRFSFLTGNLKWKLLLTKVQQLEDILTAQIGYS